MVNQKLVVTKEGVSLRILGKTFTVPAAKEPVGAITITKEGVGLPDLGVRTRVTRGGALIGISVEQKAAESIAVKKATQAAAEEVVTREAEKKRLGAEARTRTVQAQQQLQRDLAVAKTRQERDIARQRFFGEIGRAEVGFITGRVAGGFVKEARFPGGIRIGREEAEALLLKGMKEPTPSETGRIQFGRGVTEVRPADRAVFPITPSPLTEIPFFERIFVTAPKEVIRKAPEAGRRAVKELVEGRPIKAVGAAAKPFKVFFPEEVGGMKVPPPPFVTRGTEIMGEVPPELREATGFERLNVQAMIAGTTAIVAKARTAVKEEVEILKPGFQERITKETTPKELERLNIEFQKRIEEEVSPRIGRAERERSIFLAGVQRAREPIFDPEKAAETAALFTLPLTPVGATLVGGEFVQRGIPKVGKGILGREVIRAEVIREKELRGEELIGIERAVARRRVGLVGVGAAEIALGLGVFKLGERRLARDIDRLIIKEVATKKPEILIGKELIRGKKTSVFGIRGIRRVGETRLTTKLIIPVRKTKEGFAIVGGRAEQTLRFPSFAEQRFITIRRKFGVTVPRGIFADPTKVLRKGVLLEKEALKGFRAAIGKAIIIPKGKKDLITFDVGGIAREKEGFIFFTGGKAQSLRVRPAIVKIGRAGRFPTEKVIRPQKILARFDIAGTGMIERIPLETKKLVVREFVRSSAKGVTKQVQQQTVQAVGVIPGIEAGITRTIIPTITKKSIITPIIGTVAEVALRPARQTARLAVSLSSKQLEKTIQETRTKQKVVPGLKGEVSTGVTTREAIKVVQLPRLKTKLEEVVESKVTVPPIIPIIPIAPRFIPSIPKIPFLFLPGLPRRTPRVRSISERARPIREPFRITEGFLAKVLRFKPIRVTPKEVRRLARVPARAFGIRRAPILIPDIPVRKKKKKIIRRKKRKGGK